MRHRHNHLDPKRLELAHHALELQYGIFKVERARVVVRDRRRVLRDQPHQRDVDFTAVALQRHNAEGRRPIDTLAQRALTTRLGVQAAPTIGRRYFGTKARDLLAHVRHHRWHSSLSKHVRQVRHSMIKLVIAHHHRVVLDTPEQRRKRNAIVDKTFGRALIPVAAIQHEHERASRAFGRSHGADFASQTRQAAELWRVVPIEPRRRARRGLAVNVIGVQHNQMDRLGVGDANQVVRAADGVGTGGQERKASKQGFEHQMRGLSGPQDTRGAAPKRSGPGRTRRESCAGAHKRKRAAQLAAEPPALHEFLT